MSIILRPINQGLVSSAGSNLPYSTGGGLTSSTPRINALQISQPVDGSVTTYTTGGGKTGQPVSGIAVQQTVSPAVAQSDLLPLAGLAAGASYTVDLGQTNFFLDAGSVDLEAGEVTMIDPNGVPHDLFVYTITKSAGDGYNPLQLPGGRYVFLNISGAALDAALRIYVQHVGARNLA